MKPVRAARYVLCILSGLALSACASNGDVPATADLKAAARINTQLGVDYMRKDQMDLALVKLKRAVDQDPEYALAHSSLAFAYAKSGEAEKAEREYRKAISLESDNATIRNNFGVFLCGQGNQAEARRMFMDAARDKSYSTPEAAWTNAGVCSRQNKDLETAENDFREALKINAEFPDALSQMADIAYQRKDYLRARGFLQRYSTVAGDTPAVLWIGLMTERKLGDLVSARQYEKKLKRDFPESDEAKTLKTYKR